MRKYSPPQERRETVHLEPRVAKLEVGLDRLTSDVRDLANVVREQGSSMEQQIQQLIVAVTQASGPKKTDWSTIIAGVALILAIGSAAFWPMNQTVQENKQMIHVLEQKYDDHARIANHPVGEALLQRVEGQIVDIKQNHEKEMAAHMVDAKDMHETLRLHFHEELQNLTTGFQQQIFSLEKKVDLHNDRLYGRVVQLEAQNRMDSEREKDELAAWRQKAMGLTVPQPTTHTHIPTDTK